MLTVFPCSTVFGFKIWWASKHVAIPARAAVFYDTPPCHTVLCKRRLSAGSDRGRRYDAFRPTKRCEQASIHFEKAAVLFNLGALQSQLALQTERTTDTGVKEAAKLFQVPAVFRQ